MHNLSHYQLPQHPAEGFCLFVFNKGWIYTDIIIPQSP